MFQPLEYGVKSCWLLDPLTAIVPLPLVDVGVGVGLLQPQDAVDGVARLPLLQDGLGGGGGRELRPRGEPADRRRVGRRGRRRRGHLLLLSLGRRGRRGAGPAAGARRRTVVTCLGPLRGLVSHNPIREGEHMLRPSGSGGVRIPFEEQRNDHCNDDIRLRESRCRQVKVTNCHPFRHYRNHRVVEYGPIAEIKSAHSSESRFPFHCATCRQGRGGNAVMF